MDIGKGIRRALVAVLPALVAGGIALACSGEAPHTSSVPPASVKNAVTEAQLTSLTLTPQAVQRLGIETSAVEWTNVAPSRTVGGEIVVPPGQSLLVSAPVAGIVLAPQTGALPEAGVTVDAGQALMRLVALPADRDMARVEQEFAVAEAKLSQAQAEADRVAKLFADRLVAAREHERAVAELVAARAALESARGQRQLVRGGKAADVAGLTPLTIASPDAGLVSELHAAPGQTVAAGAPLVGILRTDRLWVKVPVYVGEAREFGRNAEASVRAMSGDMDGPSLAAVPVAAPPSANPASASVDLYFQLRGAPGRLQPGERVSVTIPLASGGAPATVIPFAAVVRDMSGGSWVYERTDSLTFVRRRVEVVRVSGARAVISAGLKPGTQVVTAGAAELFGVEFGAGK
jgi:RND family efflux transporter MFP subunit